ncbi:hypothetical protein BFP77_02850 [Maribacter sp. 4U21]|nr:hypothetical protein BFP77_02850 [Maribacter sp. 4U21]
MLKIAKEKCPERKFLYGDMRNFNADKLFNAILITGRFTSYFLTDDDFYQTFDYVRRALQTKGVFIFDFIDANRFSLYITSNPKAVHKSLVTGKQYLRESKWKNSNRGSISLVNWTADYYSIQQTNKTFLGNDTSVFRTFILDEIKELLKTKGFKIIECFDCRTYAFDTFVVVCKKLEKTTPPDA